MPIVRCRGCDVRVQARAINKLWCDNCARERRRTYHSQYDKYTRRKPCPECGSTIGLRASLCRPCENKTRVTRYLGEKNPNWQGGRIVDNQGYAHVRVKPSGPNPYRREHHVVWEETHGKPLPKRWVVHHLNGVRDDNRPENLLGISRRDHHIQHEAYRVRIRKLEADLMNLKAAYIVKVTSQNN